MKFDVLMVLLLFLVSDVDIGALLHRSEPGALSRHYSEMRKRGSKAKNGPTATNNNNNGLTTTTV